jgi:oligoribonuclease (3'-5' exoribonuclease)
MTLVGLDIETTGLDPDRHGTIQIGISFGTCETFSRDLNPGDCEVDSSALDVNNFTIERITNAPTSELVDEALSNMFIQRGYTKGSLTPVGWNVGGFDIPFIKNDLPLTSNFFSHRVFDLTGICMLSAGDGWRQHKNYWHEKVAEILGGESQWHDAGYDAKAALLTARLLINGGLK